MPDYNLINASGADIDALFGDINTKGPVLHHGINDISGGDPIIFGDQASGNYISFPASGGNPSMYVNNVFVGPLKSPIPQTQETVLFLFAHPDDEQYMAGTIQKLIAIGHLVYVAYTTSGKNGDDKTGLYGSGTQALADARELEAISSLTNLGVNPARIYALRGDDDALNIPLIVSELSSRLTTDGVTVDAIITFDNVGVYDNNEHKVCQRAAIDLLPNLKAVYYFTVPQSDIDTTLPAAQGDLTLDSGSVSRATNDGLVSLRYTLSAGEITKKQAVIDYHVTQYEEPTITALKNHYNVKPYEYFVCGAASLNTNDESTPRDYLKMLFRI